MSATCVGGAGDASAADSGTDTAAAVPPLREACRLALACIAPRPEAGRRAAQRGGAQQRRSAALKVRAAAGGAACATGAVRTRRCAAQHGAACACSNASGAMRAAGCAHARQQNLGGGRAK
jgi:hypothetical protein